MIVARTATAAFGTALALTVLAGCIQDHSPKSVPPPALASAPAGSAATRPASRPMRLNADGRWYWAHGPTWEQVDSFRASYARATSPEKRMALFVKACDDGIITWALCPEEITYLFGPFTRDFYVRIEDAQEKEKLIRLEFTVSDPPPPPAPEGMLIYPVIPRRGWYCDFKFSGTTLVHYSLSNNRCPK